MTWMNMTNQINFKSIIDRCQKIFLEGRVFFSSKIVSTTSCFRLLLTHLLQLQTGNELTKSSHAFKCFPLWNCFLFTKTHFSVKIELCHDVTSTVALMRKRTKLLKESRSKRFPKTLCRKCRFLKIQQKKTKRFSLSKSSRNHLRNVKQGAAAGQKVASSGGSLRVTFQIQKNKSNYHELL